MDMMQVFDMAAVLAAINEGRDGWWFLWPLVPLFWIVTIAIVLRFVVFRGRRFREASPLDQARGVLAERYSRGEIDAEEYRRRRDELQS